MIVFCLRIHNSCVCITMSTERNQKHLSFSHEIRRYWRYHIIFRIQKMYLYGILIVYWQCYDKMQFNSHFYRTVPIILQAMTTMWFKKFYEMACNSKHLLNNSETIKYTLIIIIQKANNNQVEPIPQIELGSFSLCHLFIEIHL